MWLKNERSEIEFTGGKNNWTDAVNEAEKCSFYTLDVEDEVIDDEFTACYNCRFRRWTEKSFVCLKKTKEE